MSKLGPFLDIDLYQLRETVDNFQCTFCLFSSISLQCSYLNSNLNTIKMNMNITNLRMKNNLVTINGINITK